MLDEEIDWKFDKNNFRVKIIIDDTEISEYRFVDIQEAIAFYEAEMKKDHNELKDFCIVVQQKTIHNYWNTLVFFCCNVKELNVLLESS